MKLKDLLKVIYESTEFILYKDDERIGQFKRNDIGLNPYIEETIDYIEPNDNKSIIINL